MSEAQHPFSLRVNDEEKAMLDYLRERLGLGPTRLLRLALRRLYQEEKKLEK